MEKIITSNETPKGKNWFDRYYKLMMLGPILLLILCLIYLGFFYSQNNDLIIKDVSLSGGTTITLNSNSGVNFALLESELKEKYSDINFRKLTDLRTGQVLAFVMESPLQPEELKTIIQGITGIDLNTDNSSIEFTGSALGKNFYKQLIIALISAFILMSIVIFILFRTIIPSIAVIFAAFSDIVFALAIVDYLGIKLSAAGIAAFLMLIGYSVDTNILLTTRAIRIKEGALNSRLYRAFKTGIFMTLTALLAVLPAFFLITGLPESFKQIFLILSLGLLADILNTWLTNMGIIKWYCEKKGIN